MILTPLREVSASHVWLISFGTACVSSCDQGHCASPDIPVWQERHRFPHEDVRLWLCCFGKQAYLIFDQAHPFLPVLYSTLSNYAAIFSRGKSSIVGTTSHMYQVF